MEATVEHVRQHSQPRREVCIARCGDGCSMQRTLVSPRSSRRMQAQHCCDYDAPTVGIERRSRPPGLTLRARTWWPPTLDLRWGALRVFACAHTRARNSRAQANAHATSQHKSVHPTVANPSLSIPRPQSHTFATTLTSSAQRTTKSAGGGGAAWPLYPAAVGLSTCLDACTWQEHVGQRRAPGAFTAAGCARACPSGSYTAS